MTTLSLLLVLVMIGTIVSLSSGFEFDQDVSQDQCRKDINQCTENNATMWYSCPISCSQYLFLEGNMAEERNKPEQLYDLYVKRSVATTNTDDDVISLEDNEGYITLYAVIPMLPGMAQYYYDAIEHIAHIYKYTLVAMILPCYDKSASSPSSSILQSIIDSSSGDNNNKKTKSILLEEHEIGGTKPNPVLKYLLSREIVAGNSNFSNNNESVLMTRPNIFIISHTGMFIERIVSPTIEMIERRLKVHILAMDERSERHQ
mmetsp:Transcript_30849/g.33183  ORF Transcript_30849/g.33183 Transcript_30849/m.33183 type:complete len:260 (+) Transcript_30849:51-830(+)